MSKAIRYTRLSNNPKHLLGLKKRLTKEQYQAELQKLPITDVKIKLSDRQYQDLLQKFPQKDRSWKTSCYTYLVQTEIAKYMGSRHKHRGLYTEDVQNKIDAKMEELRGITEQYYEFEKLINNPQGADTRACLETLLIQLEELHCTQLGSESPLCNKTLAFYNKLKKLQDRIPTKEEIRQIFTIQDEDNNLPSIGSFIASQLWHVTNKTIEDIYAITDVSTELKHNTSKHKLWNRIKQILLFKMDPAIKALSDAKSNLEVKGRSLHGIRFNNARAPVPKTMLESLRPLEGDDREAKHESPQKRWTSLRPFVDNLNDIETINEILKGIAYYGEEISTEDIPTLKAKHEKTASVLSQIWVFVANVLELALVLPTRLPYVLLSTALHLVLARPLDAFVSLFTKYILGKREPFAFFTNLFNRMDSLVAYIHHEGSLVRRAKNNRNKQYEDLISPELDALKSNSESLYCSLLNAFSGEIVATYVAQGLSSIVRTLGTIVKDPTYLIATAGVVKSKKLVAKYHSKIQKKFEDAFTAATKKDGDDEEQPSPVFEDDAEGLSDRPKIAAWEENHIDMYIDPAVEVCVDIADLVVGPMFRKSPGAATLFFMISNASLGAMFAGAAAGQAGHALTYVPEILSKLFTGKEISNSIAAQVIAVFLEWKIGFFTTEGIASVIKGDFEFLKEIFHEPEKITLALSILVTAGWAMHYLPLIPDNVKIGDLEIPLASIPLPVNIPGIGDHIPNIYFELYNMFVIESEECFMEAEMPASFLEDSFLSLKFLILCEGLLSGKHKAKLKDITRELIKDIRENLEKLQLPANSDEATIKEVRSCVDALLEKYEIRDIQENKELFGPLKEAILKTAEDLIPQRKALAAMFEKAMPQPRLSPDLQEDGELTTVKKELKQAILTVRKMSLIGERFDSVTDARLYYDYLDRTFEKYNFSQREVGHFDKQIDKRPYLESFYNQNCHIGSNNFIRALTCIPGYPFTKLYQLLQKALATFVFDSPSTLHKVAKSEAKNTAMLWQLVAMFGRMGHEVIRAYTYTARALICIAATPLALTAAVLSILSLPFKLFERTKDFDPLAPAYWIMNTAIDIATALHPHRTRGIGIKAIQTSYANAAHIAGTNSDDLNLQSKRVLESLSNKRKTVGVEKKDVDFLKKLHEPLEDYYQTRNKRLLFKGNSARLWKQMPRISTVINNRELSRADKAAKILEIEKELPGLRGRSVLMDKCKEIRELLVPDSAVKLN